METLPISIRTTKPNDDAVLIEETIHTGGAYLFNDEVYKPLDGRPYINADFHLPTQEDEMLIALSDLLSFPKNWRIETLNNRRWLVRPYCKYVLKTKEQFKKFINLERALQIEKDWKEANRRGWEINDMVTFAMGKDYKLFFLDLSAANFIPNDSFFGANEDLKIIDFWFSCGFDFIGNLRKNAKSIISDPLRLRHTHQNEMDWDSIEGFKFVYASFNRPISSMWAKFGQPVLIEHQSSNWDAAIPHSWVISRNELDEDIVYNYELKLAWESIR